MSQVIALSAPCIPQDRLLSLVNTFLSQLDAAKEPNVDKIETAINLLA